MDCNSRGIWQYEDKLPYVSPASRITLGEGHTPLVLSRSIGNELGLSRLYFKLESSNPTGSYKDRIAAAGVSLALDQGRAGLIGTSSGNAGASFAAYAACAKMPYELFTLEDVVEAKLAQAIAFGATVKKVQGLGHNLEISRKLGDFIEKKAMDLGLMVAITAFKYNAPAMMGVKTITYELMDQFGSALPDAIFIPVGGGGLFTGITQGFSDGHFTGDHTRCPSFVAVQSAGCSNIVEAWRQGKELPLIGDSTSQISGLQVAGAPDGQSVLKVLNTGGGWGEAVDDHETWLWQERLAAQEGILCEPAAAITLAAVSQSVRDGRLGKDSVVVCVISGAGYKDAARLQSLVQAKPPVSLYTVEQLRNEV